MTTTRKAAPHDKQPNGEPLRWMGAPVTLEQFDANILEQEAIKATARRNREAQAAAEAAARMRPIGTVMDAFGVPLELVADSRENSRRIGQRLAENANRRQIEDARAASAALKSMNKES